MVKVYTKIQNLGHATLLIMLCQSPYQQSCSKHEQRLVTLV